MEKLVNEEVSAGAVICKRENNEVKFLLVYSKRNNEWGFAKGHIEKGETAIEAAKREILEETGLVLKKEDFIKDFCFTDTYKIKGTLPSTKDRIVNKKAIYYLGVVKSNCDNTTKKEDEEIGKIKWMTFDEAISCLKYEKQKEMLKTAKQFLTKLTGEEFKKIIGMEEINK